MSNIQTQDIEILRGDTLDLPVKLAGGGKDLSEQLDGAMVYLCIKDAPNTPEREANVFIVKEGDDISTGRAMFTISSSETGIMPTGDMYYTVRFAKGNFRKTLIRGKLTIS